MSVRLADMLTGPARPRPAYQCYYRCPLHESERSLAVFLSLAVPNTVMSIVAQIG